MTQPNNPCAAPVVKIALVPTGEYHGQTPYRAYDKAAGMDLRAPFDFTVVKGHPTTVDFGVKVEPPEGWCVLLAPRSGLGLRGLILANTVGLIDNDYRGNLIGTFCLRGDAAEDSITFKEGDRVMQAAVVPYFTGAFMLVDEKDLSETARGKGGYGSSGVA